MIAFGLMIRHNGSMEKANNIAPILLVTIPLVWLAMQFETALNADHAWLFEAANRLLNGQGMSDAYFDPNPPLSVLLYIPSVLIAKSGLVEAPYAHYIFTFLCFSLSIWMLDYLLKCFSDKLGDNTRAVLLFGYVCANTVLTSSGEFYFGERDQFIFMGLCILCLYQLLITFKNIYRWEYVVISLSVICLLLKPHYLIIPAIFILHRIINTKEIKASIMAPDVYCLAGVSAAYLLGVMIFFSDYAFEVFPVFKNVYLTTINPAAIQITFIYIAVLMASFVLALITGLSFEKLKLPLILFAVSLACCLLFWVQMKGIYYQIIPAIGFWICGFGLLINNFAKHYLGNKIFVAPMAMICMLIASFTITPPKTALSHANYQTTPLYKLIDSCAPNCKFYMFIDSIDIIHQLAFYSGSKHASRFPVLWWLPHAIENPDGEFSQKFKSYVISDIQKYKPDYLIIADNLKINDQDFDLLKYLSSDQNYQDTMEQYILSSETHDNRSNYFAPGAESQDFPLTLKIFKRKR